MLLDRGWVVVFFFLVLWQLTLHPESLRTTTDQTRMSEFGYIMRNHRWYYYLQITSKNVYFYILIVSDFSTSWKLKEAYHNHSSPLHFILTATTLQEVRLRDSDVFLVT